MVLSKMYNVCFLGNNLFVQEYEVSHDLVHVRTCRSPAYMDDLLKVVVFVKDTRHFSRHPRPGDAGPVDGDQAVDVAVAAPLGQLAVSHGEGQGAQLLHLRLLDGAGGVRALPQEA